MIMTTTSRWCHELTGRAAYAVGRRRSHWKASYIWHQSASRVRSHATNKCNLLCGLPLPSPWLRDCARGDKSHRWARSAELSVRLGELRVRTASTAIYLILNMSNPSMAITTAARLLVDGHSWSAWRDADPVPGNAPQVHLTSSSAPPELVLQSTPALDCPSR